MGKCKRKMADGGMVAAGQKQWQERLAEMWATKPKPAAYADGGAVETPEQVMARMAKKYGTGVPEQKAETPPQRPPTGQPQQNPQQPTSRAASLVDSVNRRNDELKKAANYAVGGMVGEGSTIQQSLGMIGGPRYDVGGDNAPVWDDGTRRDGLTPEQAQQLKSEKAMADARASAGIGAQAAPVVAPQPAPLMTMAERQVAQGINPNAAYRPGGPGDPHASGGMAATAAQTASLAAAQPALPVPPIAQPIVNPMDATQRRGQRRTAAYADGGMVRFAGKGGPRDDQIPVKVAGAEIRVSDGEQAVILPAKTANNPGAVQAIGQIIQQSNDGRAPKMGMADGGRYARGANALTPAELAAQIYQEQTGQQAPTGANPAPATRGATGVFQSGSTASFQAPQPGQVSAQATGRTDPGKYPYTGQAAQNPYQDASLAGAVDAVTPTNHLASHPIYSGVSLGGMIDAVTSSGGAQQAAPSQQTKIVAQPAPGGGMAAVATQPKPQATQQAAHAKGVLDWLPEGGVLRPENRQEFGQKFAEISERGMAGRGILTGKPAAQAAPAQKAAPQQSSTTSAQAGRETDGAQAIVAAPDPRIAATTGNSGARVMPSGAIEVNMGRGFDPTKLKMAPGSGMISDATGRTMILNDMGPNQYTAADGTKNARWDQTQAYIDAQNRLQADKLRVAEMQAIRHGMNPVQAAAATQGMAQAAQRAPLDRAVVQQQIETGKVAAENNKALQGLAAEMQQTDDPAKLAALETRYRVLTGKSKEAPPEQLDNIVVKEYSPDGSGMVTGERIETRSKTGRAGSALPAPTKVITKEMQAKLAPALAAQGLTLEKYAAMHGLTVSK